VSPRRSLRRGRTKHPTPVQHVAVIVENVPVSVDTRLRKQVDDLLEAGFRVSVITMRDPDNIPYREKPGLLLLEYPRPKEGTGAFGYAREYGISLSWAVALLGRLRLRGRIDVLQVCQPPDIYFPLARVLRWAGARIVVDQRDLMPELLAARYERPSAVIVRVLHWLERRTQRAADRTVCVNDYLRDRLVSAGADPERTYVVRNGPVLSRVQQTVADDALRAPHDFLVCWAGKMGTQDRVDLAITVAERVIRDHGRTDCGFVLLGDGECLDDLRALTAKLDLDPWVSLPGWLPESRVFTYLASADLGLDTSLQAEVSPVKVMEYMAFGLPVVCFDLEETRILAAGAAALSPPGDSAALARSLIGLLDDAEERKQLGAVGLRRVQEELAWERQTATYLAAIASD
jgi:glycosyltransferase involved in cell wall biosynthesis